MQIGKGVLDCCVFICRNTVRDNVEGVYPVATGFIVAVPLSNGDRVAYVVTAQHVVAAGRGDLLIRVNVKDGGSKYVTTSASNWDVHLHADVAVHPFAWELDMEVVGIPITEAVGPDYSIELLSATSEGEKRVKHLVGVGDEIAVPCLLLQDYGRSRNLPIMRFGHIARMPSEVNTPLSVGGVERGKAWLIECTSWGGMSGGPVVWFQLETSRIPIGDNAAVTPMRWRPVLLGSINGHIEFYHETKRTGDVFGKVESVVNTGIAVVTPSEAIIELLYSDEVASKRPPAPRPIYM